MSKQVFAGATITCDKGTARVALQVQPDHGVHLNDKAAATICDALPVTNVPSFGDCKLFSPSKPCMPSTNQWLCEAGNVSVGGVPALTSDCRLICMQGGMITIVDAGQTKVNID